MMKQQLPNPRRRGIETLIHIIVWGIVIGFPFLMMTRSGFNISLADYLRHGSSSTLSFFLVFYINYCLLIPRYLFEGRIRQYLLLNTLLIICITTGATFGKNTHSKTICAAMMTVSTWGLPNGYSSCATSRP